jgi:ubiquinone/menaquinone biosynthesis C-methylase UbiE
VKPQLDPAAYPDWFRTELGQRVWRDERRALDRALGDVAGRIVLDVGAGASRLARELADRGARLVALDRSAAMLTAAAGWTCGWEQERPWARHFSRRQG